MHAPATSSPPLPHRPRLVLRIGFAGRKDPTPEEQNRLESSLLDVLNTLGHRLAAVIPGVPVGAGQEPRVARFYQPCCPLLRLITGLCEGADAIAGQVLERVHIGPDADADCSPETRCLQTELAAVLPFDIETYRRSRPSEFRPEFDRQLAQSAWVLSLDGIYEKPEPDTPLAKQRRARAYRSQSAFLLRQSDVLIAAANPDDTGKAGGTLETVRDALAFELPVVFIHTGTGNVHLVEPEDDLHSTLADPPPDEQQRRERLQQWVTQLTTDPDSGLAPVDHAQDDVRAHGESLLTEYFDNADSPPRQRNGKRRITVRERVWSRVENFFRSGPTPASDPTLAPFDAYRSRASALNRHYSGLYRGAVLLNYGLAIVAVALAAASLTLLGTSGHTAVGEQLATLLHTAGHAGEEELVVSPVPPRWLLPVLLVLTAGKLGILFFISRNTYLANHAKWNDRAVDYRYLAERLRGMFYLPLAGSHQPPVAAPPQFASRVVRQSAIDWLFEAMVRSISPGNLDVARSCEIPSHDGRGTLTVQKLLTVQPLQTVIRVRDGWIEEQAKYHERNARTMHSMHHALEQAAKWLGWAVIVVVAADLVLIGGEVFHWLPDELHSFAKTATPWLIFISAVLPAVVAALGGIRFQSECQRLAERSAVICVMLRGRKQASPHGPRGRWGLADALATRIANARSNPATDSGSWSHDTLRITERVATDFVQEAAEWSVLYAKEVSEPG